MLFADLPLIMQVMGEQEKSKNKSALGGPDSGGTSDPELGEIASGETQSRAKAYGTSMKVIQPVSPDLQPSAPGVGHRVQPPALTTNPTESTTPDTSAPNIPALRPNLKSIYPEVRRGVGILATEPQKAAQATNAAASNKLRTLITICGSFILVVAAFNVWAGYDSMQAIHAAVPDEAHFTTFGIIGIILSSIVLLLDIGIITKREVARLLFIGVAFLILIFSIYNTFWYADNMRKIENSEKFVIGFSQFINSGLKEIKNPTDEQKATVTKNEQNLEIVKRSLSKSKLLLASIIGGYVVSIIPAVFLTVGRAKDEFN